MEEGRPPLAGGDVLLIQGATVPLTMAGQVGQIPVKADDERRDVNVVLNSAPISLTMPEVKASPVSVHVEAAVPPSPDPLSGSIVREVLERDEHGTPMKTITRNVVDRSITEVVEWDDYGVPVRIETRPAGG